MVTRSKCNELIIRLCCCSINARSNMPLKSRLSTKKTVSNRTFQFLSETRIQQLKQIRLKKSTESKSKWAVKAYTDWRNERLRTFNYDYSIYMTDLHNLSKLTKPDLQHSLCRFVPEVTRQRGEGPYPGKTLYQMIVAIQKYLRVNKLLWDLVEGKDFSDLKIVLDNVMQERTEANIGVVTKQAEVITYDFEERLWSQGILGEDTPTKLRNTVLFLLGINLLLRAVDEHYNLRRDMPYKDSQLSVRYNEFGEKCILYQEDTVTKTHDGGLSDMNRDRKEVWIFPNKNNVVRCPVRLILKYISLCPPNYQKKENFYLQSLQKPTPKLWYGEQVVGSHTLSKVIKTLMSDAEIEGYFTNHSARHTGGTRLFQAGVERKLVKEMTGHTSDAVDKYQKTSHEQIKMMSEVLQSKPCTATSTRASKSPGFIDVPKNKVTEEKVQKEVVTEECANNNVGLMVNNIIEKIQIQGKTTIKIQIEIIHDQ